MMEVPKYKVAQHETIQEACAKFFEAGEEVETVKQGEMKDQLITKTGFDNQARKRVREAKNKRENEL